MHHFGFDKTAHRGMPIICYPLPQVETWGYSYLATLWL